MIINMDNKTTLQLAIEKRDSLVKLNKKLENNFNISANRTMVPFLLTALAFLFFRNGASSDDKVYSFFGIIGVIASVVLGLYFIFKAYNVSSYKYYLDIFDDDLAVIKSSENLSYRFEQSLKTYGRTQYVRGSFLKDIKKELDDTIQRITFIESLVQSKFSET